MDNYFRIKMALELFCASIGITILCILFISMLISTWRYENKVRYLQSIGFERYLINVASVGNKAWYGWKREETNSKISEADLEKISYKKLKEKFPL